MLSLFLNEDRAIWLSLAVSLLIHASLFIFSGKAFIIKQPQFSVQPSIQTVEVSFEEMKNPGSIAEKGEIPTKPIEKINRAKEAAKSVSGVKVKANPDYFRNPPPEYPALAKQMRQEGLVILEVDVDSQGMSERVEVEKSSGYHLLDQAALESVRHWRFQPGRVGDLPVASTVTIPVRFQLQTNLN